MAWFNRSYVFLLVFPSDCLRANVVSSKSQILYTPSAFNDLGEEFDMFICFDGQTELPLWSPIAFHHKNDKEFIDITLCLSVATSLAQYGPLQSNVTSSIKPEIRNISQSCRRTEPRPQGICTQILRRPVQWFQRYARGQTHTHRHTLTHADKHIQTDRRVDHNYWDRVKMWRTMLTYSPFMGTMS